MSIVDWDATELSRAIHARQVSCEEVMQAYLAQIHRFNPSVNALVSLRDADDVLAEARACDRELDQGQSRGWMHGMPQAIKDLAATKGVRTTLGSPLFAEHVFVAHRDSGIEALDIHFKTRLRIL